MYTMIITTVIVIVIVVMVMIYQANQSTEVAGLTTARALSKQVVSLRTFYTGQVVQPALKAGIDVNYDFAEKEKTIPLPATMVNALGKAIQEEYPGTNIKLYSNYPFKHHKVVAEKDDFEKAALQALEGKRVKEFYRLENFDGRLTMRYAVADVMRKSCVNCHNEHPESPKRDWKEDDVRGVVEVMVPVDKAQGQLYFGSLIQGIIVFIGFCTIVLLTGVALRRMNGSLRTTMSTVADTSSKISVAVDSFHHMASEQATAMNETTATMEQLGTSSQFSAAQAETGAQESSQSLSLAEDGADAVQQTLDFMLGLKERVRLLSKEILTLSEKTEQIEQISAFVGDLAKQTNVLAINAAVEAAHAGEHGRGFAVVATEIRKMADQSADSVGRIHELVVEIQRATNSSVMATEEGTKVVEQATTLTKQTARVFDELASSVGNAAESVEQISVNNNDQASAFHQVIETIDSLNQKARDSAERMNQISEVQVQLNHALKGLQKMIGSANQNTSGNDGHDTLWSLDGHRIRD